MQVYLNIVGGLKVQETAADLAVALAVVSSFTTIPVRSVIFDFFHVLPLACALESAFEIISSKLFASGCSAIYPCSDTVRAH